MSKLAGVMLALAASLSLGCESEPSPGALPRPTSGTEVTPALRTIRTQLTLSQGELGQPPAVVLERDCRSDVELARFPAELRLVQSYPERVRLRVDGGPWEQIQPEAQEQRQAPTAVPGQGLVGAWLPNRRVRAGDRWQGTGTIELIGQPLEIEHHCVVVTTPEGGLRIEMTAFGRRGWEEAGVLLEVEGEGQATLHGGPAQWPDQIELTYRVRTTGDLGADAEATVAFSLVIEEPQS